MMARKCKTYNCHTFLLLSKFEQNKQCSNLTPCELTDHIYNHGILTRNEAESILSSVDYNCFLVRQSPNAVGCVVYSYKDFGVFNHVKQEGTIDQDFIHKTEGSICLMPVHLQRKGK